MGLIEHLPNKILREIRDIPPLPDVVVKVMQQTRDPNVSARELTETISMDQGLTGNILRLCNSAYYGIPRVVSSLTQAIMYLGFHTVRSLVLTCSVSNLFNPDKKIYGYSRGGIWYHTVACAMTSELICKRIKPDLHDTAFTAGLLHDVGQLILGVTIKDTSDTIMDLMINGGLNELDAERQVLGFSHEEVGGLLADNWNFPEELIQAIRYHHHPETVPTPSLLPAIVHLADTIVLELGYGIELEQMKYQPSAFALEYLKMDNEKVAEIKEKAAVVIQENTSLFMEIEQQE